MATDITQLLSPTLVYMLFCYFATFGLRKMFELKWPRLKTSDAWTDFLPIFPVIWGVVFAYIPRYPIPSVFIASAWSKGIWGFVAGALSTWAYAILQAVFKRMFGIDIATWSRSSPPAPLKGLPETMIPPPAPIPVQLDANGDHK